MNNKVISDLVELAKIIVTAGGSAFITLIGFKRLLNREKKNEKYMVLKRRERNTLDGKDIYELTDNDTVRALIDEKEDLLNTINELKATILLKDTELIETIASKDKELKNTVALKDLEIEAVTSVHTRFKWGIILGLMTLIVMLWFGKISNLFKNIGKKSADTDDTEQEQKPIDKNKEENITKNKV